VVCDLKANIHFSVHNLFSKPGKQQHFDLVFLRNVLIYFDKPDQEKVVRNVAAAMQNNGVLIIGEFESLTRLNVPFEYEAPQIYRKRGA
jgi:chemotaxis protein methyltransferase CheR